MVSHSLWLCATLHKCLNSRPPVCHWARSRRTRNLPDLRFSVLEPGSTSEPLGAGRGLSPFCDWWSFQRPRLPGPRPGRHRPASGIMQNIVAPPRARIGGLCLPLNSGKPPARRGGQQVRRGEGFAVGLGRVLASRRVSVSPSAEWGGRVDSMGGLRSTGTAQLSASPTWKPLSTGRRRIAAPGIGGSPGRAIRIRVQTPPAYGLRSLYPLASVSTSAQWGSLLSLSLARSLCLSVSLSLFPAGAGHREGRVPEGIRGWSLAGPRAVFGLEVWPG